MWRRGLPAQRPHRRQGTVRRPGCARLQRGPLEAGTSAVGEPDDLVDDFRICAAGALAAARAVAPAMQARGRGSILLWAADRPLSVAGRPRTFDRQGGDPRPAADPRAANGVFRRPGRHGHDHGGPSRPARVSTRRGLPKRSWTSTGRARSVDGGEPSAVTLLRRRGKIRPMSTPSASGEALEAVSVPPAAWRARTGRRVIRRA